MRIAKISREISGIETLESCLAYFRFVLPCQNYRLVPADESNNFLLGLKENEAVIFVYNNKIISIARTARIEIDPANNRILAIQFHHLHMFDKLPDLLELERRLATQGFSRKLSGARGWITIEEQYAPKVIAFLLEKDWSGYIQ